MTSETNVGGDDNSHNSESLAMQMQNESFVSTSLDVEPNLDHVPSMSDTGVPLMFSDAPAFQVPLEMPLNNNAVGQDHPVPSDAAHVHDLYPLPETGEMDDFWQNSQFWFDQSDLAWSEGLFDSNSPILLNRDLSSPLESLTTTMQEYFDRKSRASSPSLNKANKMWYSTPPNINDHNKDIIRIFEKIFRRNIPRTFSLFEATSTTGCKHRPAYILAMTAVGGLFCTVPGSAEVAKSMYNDARRLLLTSVNIRNSLGESHTSREDRLIVAKTVCPLNIRSIIDTDKVQFVLLALYGLCSGDKRSYEFVEVFHGNLIHSVQEYSRACQIYEQTDEMDNDNAQLLEALYILDCYRVIIMQRPPSLARKYSESFTQTPTNRSRISQLHSVIADLVSGGHAINSEIQRRFSLTSLASLSTFVWPAIYPQQNGYGTDKALLESLSPWKADFAEMACDTWLRQLYQPENNDISHLVMYHMMGIMLHTNLTVLQCFAHSTPESTARDPKRCSVAKEIYAWTQDRNYTVARWHAEQIMESMEAALTTSAAPRPQAMMQIRTSTAANTTRPAAVQANTESPRLTFESPHVPYAVYYAALVLWSAATTMRHTTASSSPTAQAQIARGERILSMHKVHVAKLLARVLSEVR
ncbi:hypothetical protein LTR10_016003 [Elasticomyces elasticus]|uniref:Transcription factor domain-containing protein n=1 Tax=Exophiala sideris TaxID=1016849 RepID=A0ABR0J2A6_9EURO|nr:hypothetical protein LTR10_016003 [Elasticomyces elasticus]KAK5024659.1 hypothetical protein LTS07_008505 [Exophiala sideris]KAK5030752.1 hypothetical protein LTR13_008106 [Exophiala sideris]KAK5054293.1 hypothetical protein LTR69_008908 [Exophiala sideris]KAK5179695.1 hypothetical protein LTR44_007863 [Eurotiomycetes sp. CCFEE 6388]